MLKQKLRAVSLILCFLMSFSFILSSCGGDSGDQSEISKNESGGDESEENEMPKIPDKNAALIWKDDYKDQANGFTDAEKIYKADYYFNGSTTDKYDTPAADGDAKFIFRGDKGYRIVNAADGYMLTLPFDEKVEADYSLSALRSKYTGESFVFTATKEDKNPYGADEHGWNIYLTEWVNRYVSNNGFLAANNLRKTSANGEYTDLLPGYTVLTYNIMINMNKGIELPYYNIAIIRKTDSYENFFLFVMKSNDKNDDIFKDIIASFAEFEAVGEPKNDETPFELNVPDYWSDETKAYYEKLISQEYVDWGMFSATIVAKSANDYDRQYERLTKELERLQGKDGLDYNYGILPTYTHIGWGDTLTDFPLDMAKEFAGGNGFNGKPVLQYTYQFTTLNNTNLYGYTPMYDILRGKYDDHFRNIARDIKEYGAPVLFRLNNEMNSDWVSYCGMVTLLDPDIFIMTWERMYDIFREEGVDNCIWIFNPIAVSTPYSRWGEALNYLPSIEQVHVLGLTHYEMGNSLPFRSFKDMYTELYNKNMPYFEKYPAIISEFAAGSGGEKLFDWGSNKYLDTVARRNQAAQAAWVRNMFDCFANRNEPGYEFCKNIKGAVWFSTNDYAEVDGKSYITNYLALDENLTETLAEFRKGLFKTQPKK